MLKCMKTGRKPFWPKFFIIYGGLFLSWPIDADSHTVVCAEARKSEG